MMYPFHLLYQQCKIRHNYLHYAVILPFTTSQNYSIRKFHNNTKH